MFCQDMEDILKDCPNCNQFIATNPEQISAILRKLETTSASQRYPEDFKTLCKYLLFSAPKVALPVRGNMVSEVQKAIQEAGSAENIRVWCFPTPEQREIFNSPKLILLAPWGSGKTLFMPFQQSPSSILICLVDKVMSHKNKTVFEKYMELVRD